MPVATVSPNRTQQTHAQQPIAVYHHYHDISVGHLADIDFDREFANNDKDWREDFYLFGIPCMIVALERNESFGDGG